jgi:hypothetical protein
MSIDNIIKYIDHENKVYIALYGCDDWSSYVGEAFTQQITNSNARLLMGYLQSGDDRGVALMLKSFLEAEYGERADTLEQAERVRTRNAILSDIARGE